MGANETDAIIRAGKAPTPSPSAAPVSAAPPANPRYSRDSDLRSQAVAAHAAGRHLDGAKLELAARLVAQESFREVAEGVDAQRVAK